MKRQDVLHRYLDKKGQPVLQLVERCSVHIIEGRPHVHRYDLNKDLPIYQSRLTDGTRLIWDGDTVDVQ
jgi:hypothetical protein